MEYVIKCICIFYYFVFHRLVHSDLYKLNSVFNRNPLIIRNHLKSIFIWWEITVNNWLYQSYYFSPQKGFYNKNDCVIFYKSFSGVLKWCSKVCSFDALSSILLLFFHRNSYSIYRFSHSQRRKVKDKKYENSGIYRYVVWTFVKVSFHILNSLFIFFFFFILSFFSWSFVELKARYLCIKSSLIDWQLLFFVLLVSFSVFCEKK